MEKVIFAEKKEPRPEHLNTLRVKNLFPGDTVFGTILYGFMNLFI